MVRERWCVNLGGHCQHRDGGSYRPDRVCRTAAEQVHCLFHCLSTRCKRLLRGGRRNPATGMRRDIRHQCQRVRRTLSRILQREGSQPQRLPLPPAEVTAGDRRHCITWGSGGGCQWRAGRKPKHCQTEAGRWDCQRHRLQRVLQRKCERTAGGLAAQLRSLLTLLRDVESLVRVAVVDDSDSGEEEDGARPLLPPQPEDRVVEQHPTNNSIVALRGYSRDLTRTYQGMVRRLPWAGSLLGMGVVVQRSRLPGDAGLGLFATRAFRRGERITGMDGHVFQGDNQAGRNAAAGYPSSHFAMLLHGDRWLAGYRMRDPPDGIGGGSYANDATGGRRRRSPAGSSNNNARIRLVDAPGIPGFGILLLYATRAIAAGEEVLVSYGRTYWQRAAEEEDGP